MGSSWDRYDDSEGYWPFISICIGMIIIIIVGILSYCKFDPLEKLSFWEYFSRLISY